nr:MAG TPA: hypothetical protein [Caudoviricetes sp.]
MRRPSETGAFFSGGGTLRCYPQPYICGHNRHGRSRNVALLSVWRGSHRLPRFPVGGAADAVVAVPSIMEHLYRCRQGKPFPSMCGNNAGAARSALYDAVVLPYMAYVRFTCLAGHGARFCPRLVRAVWWCCRAVGFPTLRPADSLSFLNPGHE